MEQIPHGPVDDKQHYQPHFVYDADSIMRCNCNCNDCHTSLEQLCVCRYCECDNPRECAKIVIQISGE